MNLKRRKKLHDLREAMDTATKEEYPKVVRSIDWEISDCIADKADAEEMLADLRQYRLEVMIKRLLNK